MGQFIATTLQTAAPIALVALAGVFAYRAGVFHLGLEGLMLIGAFVAVAVTIATGSVWLGLVSAIGADVFVSAVFFVIIVPLHANVIIAGLGLSGVGLGITTFGLEVLYGTEGAIQAPAGFPRPVTGVVSGPLAAVSELSIIVWVTPLVVLLSWFVLRRSRFGLQLKAVGEHPFAARSAGVSPAAMKLVALLIAGALCAIGGADLALGGLQFFSQDMTSGRGFIAFTAVLFGAGDPLGAALASLFFGFADAVGVQSQLISGVVLPREFVLMLPYVVTILAVWISSVWRRGGLDATAAFSELRD